MRCQIKNIIYKNLYYLKNDIHINMAGGLGGQLAPPNYQINIVFEN